MSSLIDKSPMLKSLSKRPWYCRARQFFPMQEPAAIDDRDHIKDANLVTIDWPARLKKPRFGIVPDVEPYPRWTKYCRFLDNNAFEHEIYNIHKSDWIEKAKNFDIILNIWSCEASALDELREKYHFLETYMGKRTFPSPAHAMLYEDKKLEAYIASVHGLPFAKTHISQDKQDALEMIRGLDYPVVSKIVPSSGSVGVELVRNREQARKIVLSAFSRRGRPTHNPYVRQKNLVYFQEFIPNDGYDLRVIVTGSLLFGYYRKAPKGDFRASGMHMTEKRALPPEALNLALKLNAVVKSPMLVADMVRSSNGGLWIVEYSPVCQMAKPEQLKIDGIPGAYVHEGDGSFRFQPGRWWVHELALREFLLCDYLPSQLRT